MFDYFRKRREQREAKAAQSQAFQKVVAEFQSNESNSLEMALVLQLMKKDNESLTTFFATLGSSDVYTLNAGSSRVDTAVTQGPDGLPYVIMYSSLERATRAAGKASPDLRAAPVSSMELLFSVNDGVGAVLNPNDEHLRWVLNPEQLAFVTNLFEQIFRFIPGGLYSIWQKGAFRVAKILQTDEGGIHIRIYANTWSERPDTVEVESLSLDALVGSDGSGVQAVGHVPVSRRMFLGMGPRKITETQVQGNELDGYRVWQEANGGYFGS